MTHYRTAEVSPNRFQVFFESSDGLIPTTLAGPVHDSALMDAAKERWRVLPRHVRQDVCIIDTETGTEVWRYGYPSADWTKRGLSGLRVEVPR